MVEKREIRAMLPAEPADLLGVALLDAKVLPVMRGQGNVDWQCSRCSAVLLETMELGQVRSIGVRCPLCGALSRIL